MFFRGQYVLFANKSQSLLHYFWCKACLLHLSVLLAVELKNGHLILRILQPN